MSTRTTTVDTITIILFSPRVFDPFPETSYYVAGTASVFTKYNALYPLVMHRMDGEKHVAPSCVMLQNPSLLPSPPPGGSRENDSREKTPSF